MHPDTEAYLNGELKDKALEQFEVELSRNPALQEEVERLRPVLRDLKQAGLSRKIKAAIHTRKTQRRNQRIGIILGVLLGLGCLGWFWFRLRENETKTLAPNFTEQPVNITKDTVPDLYLQDQQRESPQKPVAENSLNEPRDITARRQYLAIAQRHYQQSSEFDPLRSGQQRKFEEARAAFLEKKYDEALKLIKGAEVNNSPEAQYLEAHILFYQSQFEQASRLFDAIATDPATGTDREPAEWYALLAMLAQGKIAIVETRLKKILADDQHTYYLLAKNLNAALKK